MTRTSKFACSAIVAGLAFAAPLALADAHQVAPMAKIVAELQHFPSGAAKESLAAIVADASSSPAERQLAEAIAAIQHKVTGTHVDAVAAIAADEALPVSVRELARVLSGINHVPSADQVAALKAITGGH